VYLQPPGVFNLNGIVSVRMKARRTATARGPKTHNTRFQNGLAPPSGTCANAAGTHPTIPIASNNTHTPVPFVVCPGQVCSATCQVGGPGRLIRFSISGSLRKTAKYQKNSCKSNGVLRISRHTPKRSGALTSYQRDGLSPITPRIVVRIRPKLSLARSSTAPRTWLEQSCWLIRL